MDAVEELLAKVKRMPTIPDVAMAVWRELEDPECDLARAAEMIGRDPVLASEVIKIANSPAFGGVSQTSVSGAIMRLGMQETSRIVSTVSIMASVSELPPPLTPQDFWMLGLGTALTARNLARDLKFDDIDQVYLAGLVHCLGEGMLALNFPDRFLSAIEQSSEQGIRLSSAITAEFGASSYAFCARLLQDWNFPASVIEAVAYQANPTEAPESSEMALAVFAANRFCQTVGVGPGLTQELDESWLEEIPEPFCERIATLGHSDMASYLLANLSELVEIRDIVRGTFSS